MRIPLAAVLPRDEKSGAESERGIAGRRVLVVDDKEDAATSLGMLIEVLGAEARVVHHGLATLEAFGEYEPDVVLLDMGMPGMDGYEVARAIRARFADRRVLLIALRSRTSAKHARRASITTW